MLTVVPTSVCGREKRHNVTGAASHAAGTPVPRRVPAARTLLGPPLAPGPQVQEEANRYEGGTRERTRDETQQPPRRPRLTHALGRDRGGGRRAGLARAARYGEAVSGLTGAASPRRREPELLDLSEARGREPVAVLGLGGKEHPDLRQEARHPAPRRQRADHEDRAPRPHHAMCLGDRPSRIRPVLDAAAGDVAVERIFRE